MPRTRVKPTSPDDGWESTTLEDQLYHVLQDAFDRADAAARAVARLEYKLTKDLNVQESEEEEKQQPVGQEAPAASALRGAGQEFDSATFDQLFTNLNTLKMVNELADLLGLQHLKQELTSILLDDKFRSRPQHTRSGQERTAQQVVGSDSEVMLQSIKRMVEQRARRQSSGNGTGVQKAHVS